uniref:Galectin domain-containing protein n=1 Tax=Meloidogyne incognita TaxID=6306 RepID=A0A914LV54_MELIC
MTLLLLIICSSFMVATIETATCNDPIIYNNLNLPATINLAQLPFGRGFLPDKSIVINGVVFANPDLFVVNLFEDGVMYQTADVPFHFKPLFRYNPTRVVRNNWIRNRGWGREETSGGFPFKAGQPFILEFVATPRNTIYIYINNQYFATFSRVDLSRISQLYIDGRGTIRVNSLTLCPNQVITTTTLRPTTTTDEPTTTEEPTTTTEEPTTTTEEPTTTTEEPTTTPLPTCPYPIVIPYPKIPATIDLLKLGFESGFAPPKRIIFVGFPTNTSDRFIINLYSDGVPGVTATTLFHFNPRFNEKQVIRNTWSPITGWGREERYGGFPFNVGEPFVLEIIAAPKNMIIVHFNYKPFITFSRDDLSKLSLLGVSLAIELSSVVLCPDKPITTTIEPTTTTEEPTTTTEEPTTTTEEPTTTTEEPATTTEEPTTTTEEPTTTTEEPTTTTEEPTTTTEEPTTTTEEPTTTTEEPTKNPTTTTKKPTTTLLPTTTPTKPPPFCPEQIVLNNLKIPATIDFVKLGFGTGFRRPKRIIIFGTPLAQPTAFNIHIGEPGKLLVNANVLFHMSPRFHENKVIRNTWIVGKGWEKEENYGGFPFKVGEPFVLELTDGSDNLIAVKVNNKSFVSFGRYNLDKVSQMEIENGVQVSSVILCPAHRPTTTTKNPTTTTEGPTTTTEEPTTTTEEPTTTTEEPTTTTRKPSTPTTKKLIPTTPILQYCPKQIVFNNVKIPARINITVLGFGRGFTPYKRILILGTPTAPTRFDINLAEDGVPERTANILFHFNPRFTENQVIRDTWIIGKGWVRQERTGGFPFTVGQSFELVFRAAPGNTINVFVNNKPFVDFARYDLSKISQLGISHAVKITSVILCNY